jgi:hypothetical protein
MGSTEAGSAIGLSLFGAIPTVCFVFLPSTPALRAVSAKVLCKTPTLTVGMPEYPLRLHTNAGLAGERARITYCIVKSVLEIVALDALVL